MNGKVYYQKWITRNCLQTNPNTVYIFGDNLDRTGFGGQAKEMRGEPNAYGIPTKRYPSMSDDSFFHDNDPDAAQIIMSWIDDMRTLSGFLMDGKTLSFHLMELALVYLNFLHEPQN